MPNDSAGSSAPARPTTEAILAALPELAPYGRAATVLEPLPGRPGPWDSSVGGPVLWPADEPWPVCSVPDELEESGEPSVAMVPVAQVFARDAPGPWWPEDADLLQVLWCPNSHWDPPHDQADGGPTVTLRWRRVEELANARVVEPAVPVRHEEYGLLPEPCTLRARSLVDFPFREVLPPELRPGLSELVRATGDGKSDVITRVAGWKLGGWPTWHLAHPLEFACSECGTPLTLLFTAASDDLTTGVIVGRFGDLRIFTCPQDVGHPFQVDVH